MNRRFEYAMSLPKGFDERTRLCVVEGKFGKHALLIATHPEKRAIVIDMNTKTWREIDSVPRA